MFFSRLCVIGIVILGYVEEAVVFKHCNDCVPYTFCSRAINLVDRGKDDPTIQTFMKEQFDLARCGYLDNIDKICCSEVKIPSIHSRSGSVKGSSNTESLVEQSTFKSLQQNRKPELKAEPPNNVLPTQDCGTIAADRIIGGVDAKLYEFPWMVLIAYNIKDTYKFGCAGSLINSRYVLTAAHCVVSKDYRFARIGELNVEDVWDCQGNVCENNIQDIVIEDDIVHDDYYTSNKPDIALFRLKHPVTMPLKNAFPVCLPTTTEIQNESITNKMAIVAGWGLDEKKEQFNALHKVEIPVHPSSVCKQYYGTSFGQKSTQFCAGIVNKDSCRGDSGGPLIMETKINGVYRYVQYGIVSRGYRKCGTEAPGIYTDVRKYINWIQESISVDN